MKKTIKVPCNICDICEVERSHESCISCNSDFCNLCMRKNGELFLPDSFGLVYFCRKCLRNPSKKSALLLKHLLILKKLVDEDNKLYQESLKRRQKAEQQMQEVWRAYKEKYFKK